MEEYQKALVRFLKDSLAERRERLIGFASSPKQRTQQKLVRLVYHELETMLKLKVQVQSLSESVWNTKAYLFCEPRYIGCEYETLTEALEGNDGNHERLAITQDGKFGCLRTEMSGDIYIHCKKSSD